MIVVSLQLSRLLQAENRGRGGGKSRERNREERQNTLNSRLSQRMKKLTRKSFCVEGSKPLIVILSCPPESV